LGSILSHPALTLALCKSVSVKSSCIFSLLTGIQVRYHLPWWLVDTPLQPGVTLYSLLIMVLVHIL
jgi:hypothetical protein